MAFNEKFSYYFILVLSPYRVLYEMLVFARIYVRLDREYIDISKASGFLSVRPSFILDFNTLFIFILYSCIFSYVTSTLFFAIILYALNICLLESKS